MNKIEKTAKRLGLKRKNLKLYGDYIAKVESGKGKKDGKLILVTAMTSNKAGVGKTTISIGLADAINKLGKSCALSLREPSMGPVFGIKGGATGGGKASVVPSDEINLHFTGDFHAIAQANNLLASIIDNHIFQGNELEVDTKQIFFKRCLDLNERSLRNFEYKIGKETISSGFNITAASEVMAILSLSENLEDLKQNLGDILVALNKNGQPIYAEDLNAQEAMTLLLKDAFKPNLVQTLEGNPAIVHCGPFANIAHGCSSLIATKTALSHADYCVTEAGFGSDLGAEKFFDIKCRLLKKVPSAVVLVVTLDVVKEQGNGDLIAGFENVKRHIQSLRDVFGVNFVVAINKHKTDGDKEHDMLVELCEDEEVVVEVCSAYDDGSAGCLALAKAVLNMGQPHMNFAYELNDSTKTKIEKIATKVYGAKSVEYSEIAEEKLKLATKFGFDHFYVNIAKTQFSFSDDKNLLGAPRNFVFKVSDVEIRSGAKMIVPIAGNMLLMPGLGKNSNYKNMKIDENGTIEGLF